MSSMSAANMQTSTAPGGLRAPFSAAHTPLERLPILRSALERTGAACSEELRQLVDSPVRLILHGLESASAEEIFAPHEGKSAVGVLEATKWDARCILSADRVAIYAIVEVMLGGDGKQPAYAEERPPSDVEIAVAGTFFAVIGKALAAAFAPFAETPLGLEGISGGIDFERTSRSERMLCAKFRLEVFERAGEILLAIPHTAIEAHRKALSQAAPKPAPQPDPLWTQQIQKEVTRTKMVLSAVLAERKGVLGEVSRLKVGQILELDATPRSRVRVECNGERLMWCHLGKSNGFYTLRVDELVSREQEFMEDILSA